MWDDFSFWNCNLSIDTTETSWIILFLIVIFKIVLTIGICLKIGGRIIIHLNVHALLTKIEKICHLTELANVFVIGISKTKLDGFVLNSEIVIEVYDLVRQNRSRKGVSVPSFVKHPVTYTYKTRIVLTWEVFLQKYTYQNQNHLEGIL